MLPGQNPSYSQLTQKREKMLDEKGEITEGSENVLIGDE
jgi:hypothetical protein